MADELIISRQELQKLLSAACPEAALLYLHLRAGNPPQTAASLGMDAQKLEYARASLQQLGLLPEPPKHLSGSEPPQYTEKDVAAEYEQNREFPVMVGETQRRLGRTLSTEELKILLCIYRYLGLSPDVVSILVNYCIRRSQEGASGRMPSMRTVEKEAFRWADLGIDTMEQAAAYTQQQLRLRARSAQIAAILQRSDRRLTAAEEKFIRSWIDWGFDNEAIRLAYEKTCLNAGDLKWPYMNAILKSWKEQNLLTRAAAEQGDRKPAPRQSVQQHGGELSDVERQAVARMLQKHCEEG